eukprot:TRINITY_DN42338_c0_g1_i1.p1 TRINITY_DN42338_c0_g1~~TRINITY_DN42338_c0_g1_i1.p1  ORF type:complete len:389 (+),score=60.23 TRINITY_DN42338_c0_g1_i1:42-1169(+)
MIEEESVAAVVAPASNGDSSGGRGVREAAGIAGGGGGGRCRHNVGHGAGLFGGGVQADVDVDVLPLGMRDCHNECVGYEFLCRALLTEPTAPILRQVSTLLQRAAESAEAFESAGVADAARAVAIRADLEAALTAARAREAALKAELNIERNKCGRLREELIRVKADAANFVTGLSATTAETSPAPSRAMASTDGDHGGRGGVGGHLALDNVRSRSLVPAIWKDLYRQQRRLLDDQALFTSLVNRRTKLSKDLAFAAATRPRKRQRSIRDEACDSDPAASSQRLGHDAHAVRAQRFIAGGCERSTSDDHGNHGSVGADGFVAAAPWRSRSRRGIDLGTPQPSRRLGFLRARQFWRRKRTSRWRRDSSCTERESTR